MDTIARISAAEAARRLGTSLPRVKRAIERLGLPVEQRPGGRVRITGQQFERLRRYLGTAAPTPGLTPAEARVLAALARAPLGVTSARALAARAVVSPTTATRAADSLVLSGLVCRETVWLAAGRAREMELIRANFASPRWPKVAPQLARVSPPARAGSRSGRARPARVPPRLRHLFWNTAPAQLDVDRAGGYIARRLVQAGDLEGLAWGAEHLRPEHWQHAASTRGLGAEDRALARNLAGAAGPFVVSQRSEGTLNGYFSQTKLQILSAAGQRRLESTTAVAGIEVAGLSDILAMKLKVIGDRGELRDYFDVMTIEQQTGRTAEEGIGLYMARYNEPADAPNIRHIVGALGYLEDVDEDEALPVSKDEIAAYWRRRQPELVRNMARFPS